MARVDSEHGAADSGSPSLSASPDAGLPITSSEEPKLPSYCTENGGGIGVDSSSHHPAEQIPELLETIDLYPPRDPLTYTDFDKKYPPDRHGEEAQPNARVWRVYCDRVNELDDDLIQGWNSTLDVLLIFAGLFSAVATAFIIEAAKQLQHDYTQYTAVGVFAVLAALNGTVPAPASLPDFGRIPTTTRSRWINGLWFASLTFALIDALLAILVKQWLVEYASRMRQPAADAKRWAWRHFAYREGLSKWHVGVVISSLAVLLHVALFLFLFGLLAFLFDLDHSICVAGVIFTGLAASFYLAATLAPLWYGDCPPMTPLLAHARGVTLWIWDAGRSAISQTHSFATLSSKRHLPAYHGDSVISGHECPRDAQVLSWMIENLASDIDLNVAVDTIGSQDIFDHEEEFESIRQDNNPLSRDSVGRAVVRRARSLLLAINRESPDSERASLALALRSWMFIRWRIDWDTVNQIEVLREMHLFDLHILQDMMPPRYHSSTDGLSPDSNWLHYKALSAMLNRKMTWGVGTPVPVQPIQPLTLDLLLSDVSSGMKATTKWYETHWLIPAIAAIVPVSLWTVPRLKILASIVRKALELRFRPALGSTDESPDEKNLRSEWESITLDIVDPWSVSGLTAWGFAIEHAEQLAIPENAVEWLASGFGLLLECASTQPRLNLQQAERCLSCVSSSVVTGWEEDLISPSAAVKLLTKAEDVSPYWSAKLGQITFEIARRLQQSEDATDHMARLSEFLNIQTWASLSRREKLYQAAHVYIVDDVLNLLLPRPLDVTSRPSTSVWAIISQFGMSSALASLLEELARELARRAQLMTNDSTNISLTDLLHELAGNDYGTKFAIQDTSLFADIAQHGRVVSEDWWQQAKQRVLELSEDEWSARKDQSGHSTPQQLVDEIDTAKHCDEIDTAKHCCDICNIQLPRIIVARAAELSTTANPRATPVYHDWPAPLPPPAAHSATREPMKLAQRINTLLGRSVGWVRGTSGQEPDGEDEELQTLREGSAAV